MLGTATVTCGPTLRATVNVLRQINDMFFEVQVIEGSGGWDRPGKIMGVRASIMSDFAAVDEPPEALIPAPEVAEPAPLTAPVIGDEYIEILLARQAAYISRNFPYGTDWPPLLEWFIREGDEKFVILPEPTPRPKRERRPRTYRSAADLREERERVAARLDALFSKDGRPDRAAANLSPHSRSRAAARAGRRRFAQLDRDLERAGKLRARLDILDGRIRRAEAREGKAAPEQAPDHESSSTHSDTGTIAS